jgi:type I restriction enzyme S subunit
MVEVIEANLSHVDTVARGIQASIRRMRALKKRTIVEAVPVPGPGHWTAVTVEDAGSVELGRQRHPDWHSGPSMRPYLRVANVFEDRIDASDLMEMDFPPEVFDRFRLVKGDILLNEGQSPELLGRPAMYKGEPPEVAYTNSLIRFRAKDGVSPEWALLVFRRHMHAGRFARDVQITTNIAHLSAGRFKKVEFPVPPPAEQDEIVARATGRLAAIDWLIQTLEAAQLKTAAARRRLLAEAFTGRLVLRDRGAAPAQPATEGQGSGNVMAGTGEA